MREKGFIPIIILLVLALLGSLGYIAYLKGYINLSPNNVITPAPYPIVTPSISPNPTAIWKIYNSPGNIYSPFQISYPSSWIIKEQLISAEPKDLILSLTNSSGETIKITQTTGGGGTCVYYDESDYTTYEGMGTPYSSYIQISKPTLWRISKPKNESKNNFVVCEKRGERYIDSTDIGWININLKSSEILDEVKLILESIVIKPSI